MLEQHARVVKSSAEGVWVEAIAPESCGICAGHGCASRQIVELFQRLPRRYRVESCEGLSVGDRVVVSIPEGSVIRSALYCYGLPLGLILGGAMFARMGVAGDGAAVAGAMFGALTAGCIQAFYRAGHNLQNRLMVRREAVSIVTTRKGN
jgi:positive regulator of sigma E activity